MDATRFWASALVAMALPLAACEATITPGGARDGATARDVASANDRATTPPVDQRARPDTKPFSCALPPVTASLALRAAIHPRAPYAGQTLVLALHSGNTKPTSAPNLTVEHVHAGGRRTVRDYAAGGGGKASWFFAMAKVGAGQNCLVARRGARVEAAVRVIGRAPGRGVARGNGAWKVTRNHQWTCEEQPTFGNLLTVKVSDENGKPVKSARVELRVTDDTAFPVKPDTVAKTWAAHRHPKSMTTDASGVAQLTTPWGKGVRTPIDARPSWLVLQVSIAGGASDVATEITTGLWETNNKGCNYCNKSKVNVYGHWSYTIEFRRDPKAKTICDVPTDHAGQKRCAYQHLYHDPKVASCVPVAGP